MQSNKLPIRGKCCFSVYTSFQNNLFLTYQRLNICFFHSILLCCKSCKMVTLTNNIVYKKPRPIYEYIWMQSITTLWFTSMETNFMKRVGIIISHRLENPGFVSKLPIRALSDFTMWMMKSLAIWLCTTLKSNHLSKEPKENGEKVIFDWFTQF